MPADVSNPQSVPATILRGSTPDQYEEWVAAAVTRELRAVDHDDHLLFVNAWNEWSEGCHLEPSASDGRAYLEAHIAGVRRGTAAGGLPEGT